MATYLIHLGTGHKSMLSSDNHVAPQTCNILCSVMIIDTKVICDTHDTLTVFQDLTDLALKDVLQTYQFE